MDSWWRRWCCFWRSSLCVLQLDHRLFDTGDRRAVVESDLPEDQRVFVVVVISVFGWRHDDARLHLQQGRCHEDEITCDIKVEVFPGFNRAQELVSDGQC